MEFCQEQILFEHEVRSVPKKLIKFIAFSYDIYSSFCYLTNADTICLAMMSC